MNKNFITVIITTGVLAIALLNPFSAQEKSPKIISGQIPLGDEGDVTIFFTGEVNGSFEPCG